MPLQVDDDSAHWLVTDSASERIREWADQVRIDRIVQTGVLTENVAISRLAARRNPDDDGVVDILVTVSNTGNEYARRQLELFRGNQVLQTTTVSIEPRQTFHWQTQIPTRVDAITASLDSGDALVDDDRLTIPADAQKQLETSVDSQCAQPLRVAIATHPALVIVDDNSATDLEVTCPRESFPDIEPLARSVGRIRILVGANRGHGPLLRLGEASIGAAHGRDLAPVWLPHKLSTGRLHLPPEIISSAAWPGRIDTTRQRVLLQTGGLPLISVTGNADETTATVDTVIDMSHAEFVRQPEYAVLLAILVDVALGRQLLDATVGESRAVAESVIRPGIIETDSSGSPVATRAAQVPLSWLFVLAALLVLTIDVALLVGARRRVAHA